MFVDSAPILYRKQSLFMHMYKYLHQLMDYFLDDYSMLTSLNSNRKKERRDLCRDEHVAFYETLRGRHFARLMAFHRS